MDVLIGQSYNRRTYNQLCRFAGNFMKCYAAKNSEKLEQLLETAVFFFFAPRGPYLCFFFLQN